MIWCGSKIVMDEDQEKVDQDQDQDGKLFKIKITKKSFTY